MSYSKLDNQINIVASIDTISRKLRIDPSQYNVETQKIIRNCKSHNIKIKKMINLDCIEGMYLPNRFSRAYTDNPKAGVPMLGTSSMLNMKLPTDTRIFINKIRNSEKLFIESGDILISRSGTIGTSVLCGDTFVGFVASDHCIRLRLKKEVRGYIAAYLRTRYGMALLVKDAHGKVIKELTEENIQELPVMYFEDAVKKINDMMLNAVSKYDEARMLLDKVEERLDEELSSFLPKVQKSNNNIVPFHRLLINRIDPHMYNFYSEYIFREILKGKHRFLGIWQMYGEQRVLSVII
ncbi:Conserved hypothetical protein [Clostridium neonatale]|nr:Conserved hypothetical protein [Clostridium neonatale]